MRLLLVAAALLWAGTALADNGPVPIPQQFQMGAAPMSAAAPSGMETAQSTAQGTETAQSAGIDGSGYTVVAPIFTGSDGNLSYLRFNNRGQSSFLTTATIIGWPSGYNYGTVNVQVPPHASPQYSIQEILSANNITSLNSGDQGISLYLKNGNPNAGYEHVIFNSGNSFFENISMCQWLPSTDYSSLNAWVFNIHTTQLAAYPAMVFVHNYANTSQTFLVDVYEARFGGYKGTISLQANANATYGIPFSWFQTETSWTPSASEMHANLNFRPGVNGTPLTAVVGQMIYNNTFQSYVSMSVSCAINH